MSNGKGGKAESCNGIKDGNGRLAQGENDVRRSEGFGKSILNLYIIYILRNRLHLTCVNLMRL